MNVSANNAVLPVVLLQFLTAQGTNFAPTAAMMSSGASFCALPVFVLECLGFSPRDSVRPFCEGRRRHLSPEKLVPKNVT